MEAAKANLNEALRLLRTEAKNKDRVLTMAEARDLDAAIRLLVKVTANLRNEE